MGVQDERETRTAIYDHWREEAERWERIAGILSEVLRGAVSLPAPTLDTQNL
jgi:hypothetical protein